MEIIKEPIDINTVKNEIYYEISSDQKQIFAKVFIEKTFDSNDFELLTDQLFSPVFQGKTKIYLQEILKSGLEADIPIVGQTLKHTKSVKKFKVEFSEDFETWQEQSPKYVILAGISFMNFKKEPKPSLPLLLGSTVRDLAQTDFMTFFFQEAATPTLNFSLIFENGNKIDYSKSFETLKKYEPLTVPIGNDTELYTALATFDNDLLEVRISSSTNGTTSSIIPAVKPIKWTQAGDVLTITLNEGSFVTDGWAELNFPFYCQFQFYWNENNHYQSFSLLGLIQEGNVSASTIIFDRIGSPIEDEIALQNENKWLIATLTLQTAQAGGITTPVNPPKFQKYGKWEEVIENSNSSEGFNLRLINMGFCHNADNYLNFIYFNSLGGWQAFLATAENETNLNLEQMEFINALDETYQNYNTSYHYELRAGSGYKEPNQIRQAHDFLTSEQRFLSQKENLIPIILKSKQIKVDESDKTLKQFDFTFRLAFDEIATEYD